MCNIKIIGLGGLQENGKNLFIVEVDSRIFIMDAGLKYPSTDLYGVDIVVPDISYLVENKDKIAGIFLTHGHETHIGSVDKILQEIKTKVYGSKFTLALVKDALKEKEIETKEEMFVEVNPKVSLHFGNNTRVRFIEMAHDVPECYGIVINTENGNIVYTGDYTFDQNAKIDYASMYRSMAIIAKEGVLALLTESLGATNDQNRGTILEFKLRLNNIFATTESRIIFSLFSSDLLRIQQIVDIAVSFKKRIAIIGRKTQRIVNQAMNLGYLKIPDEALVNLRYIDEKNTNEDKDLVILVTGERHEPYFMLQRMSKKIDRLVHLSEQDRIVILTTPHLGTEKMAARTLDMIYKVTSHVSVFKSNLLPSSHASREEIKQMINILKPKYVIPVIGEYRHQYALRIVANCIGYLDDQIIILDNGDIATFEDGKYIGITGDVSVGEILIDGKAFKDVGDVVMRDRELLAQDGVLLISANVNPRNKRVINGPEVVSKGFQSIKENDEIMQEINRIFTLVSEKHLLTKFINWSEYKLDLKNEISRAIYKLSKRNPIIIPVLISTDVDLLKSISAIEVEQKEHV